MSRPPGRGLYRFGWRVLRHLAKLLFGFEVKGEENVPPEGGVLLASNHLSLADPPVVGVASPRELHYMAKRELFDIPIFRRLITTLNAFPISRGYGREALERALDVLRRGKALLVFPEGTRSRDGRLGPPKPGVGMLAVRAGVPVVPVALSGTKHLGRCLLRKEKLKVRFIRPLLPEDWKDISEKEAFRRVGRMVMERIAEALGETYEG